MECKGRSNGSEKNLYHSSFYRKSDLSKMYTKIQFLPYKNIMPLQYKDQSMLLREATGVLIVLSNT
jgi:hypothetical protein